MAQIEVNDGRLLIRLNRADRLWAFRGELAVPLDHVLGVEVDPERAVIIHLADERFARLVVEVNDPEASAATIRRAIDGSGAATG
jgi:hypothetical protein